MNVCFFFFFFLFLPEMEILHVPGTFNKHIKGQICCYCCYWALIYSVLNVSTLKLVFTETFSGTTLTVWFWLEGIQLLLY